MNQVILERALCLPESEIAALVAGQAIATIPRTLIEQQWSFALYTPDSSQIIAWAICDWCQILDPDNLEKLSHAAHWSQETLEQKAEEQPFLFLAALKVFRLPQPLSLAQPLVLGEKGRQKLGRFVGLPESHKVEGGQAVLSDRLFNLRAHQLQQLEPDLRANLAPLKASLQQLATPIAQDFAQDIEQFMGWLDIETKKTLRPDDHWIEDIATIGNSSDGHTFEKLVRRGFLKLGFQNHKNDAKASLDPDATGGAGGIDFYCDYPYPVVGECKASKTEKVPDSTPAQLVKLGLKILTQDEYEASIKIIMAAGALTTAADQTAQGNRMNVLRPETLQRLVEIKAHYPGSIDLMDLRPCLEQGPFGEAADGKVNDYIDAQYRRIKIRAHAISVIRKHLEDINVRSAGIRDIDVFTAFSLYCASEPPESLNIEGFKELLIELSSPLIPNPKTEAPKRGKWKLWPPVEIGQGFDLGLHCVTQSSTATFKTLLKLVKLVKSSIDQRLIR